MVDFIIINTNKSVKLENTTLEKFKQNFIWDQSGIFSISILVRIVCRRL